MNKAELVAAVHATGNYPSRAAAETAVNDVFAALANGIVADGKAQVVGFGAWDVRTRPPRQGRNPRTGASIAVGESKSIGFKAGKTLKDRL